MSYCVALGCTKPQNHQQARFCWSCGAKLRLKERYRAIQPLGQGGFGRTFLAVDEDVPSQPQCAIKQFYLTGTEATAKAIALFRQEAVRLDELGQHPQIPTLKAHFEQEGRLYLVQEFVEGQTLKAELRQQGIYNEAQIWALLRDLLPILQFVHAHQVIHRDIKPDNIIRRSIDKRLVLIDFGIAKLITETAIGETGTRVGSPEFMSPEQIRGKVFPASDIYSLGVTCIHLLTGKSPFDLFDSVKNNWDWQRYLPSNAISDRLLKILNKLIQLAIKDRYQSAEEVLKVMKSPENPLPISSHFQAKALPKVNLLNFIKTQLSQSSQPVISTIGVDYTRLLELLRVAKWQAADRETWSVMCQALGKPSGYYLSSGDINRLANDDLLIINQLWVHFSHGHFGFSIQSSIYEEVEGEYELLCDRLGWTTHQSDPDATLKFSLKAPAGHLPSRRWVGGYSWWRHAEKMAAKLQQCQYNS